jgi:dCMP deaminase
MNKHEYWMSMVYLCAMNSKDQSTHIGAVIVGPDNEIRSLGWNGFPRGINDDVPERQERPEKYFWMSHAERNAIFNAARVGIPLKGCVMYTNAMPCADCAISIIQAGIKNIYLDASWAFPGGKWEDSARRSIDMFTEAGVRFELMENFKPVKITKLCGGVVS